MNRRRELSLLNDVFERAAIAGARAPRHAARRAGDRQDPGRRGVPRGPARGDEGPGRPVESVRGGRRRSGRSRRWCIVELGEDTDAPSADVEDRLRARPWPSGSTPDEVESAVRRLGLALGLARGRRRRQPLPARRGAPAACSRCSPGSPRRGPVVLVFEDLHQADPLLLDLIEQLVKEARRVPLLVVCVARWEFLEDRPNWAGGLADAVTLWVEPLSPEHATRAWRWRPAASTAATPSGWPSTPAATRCSSSRSPGCSIARSATVPPAGSGAGGRRRPADDRAGGDRGSDRPAVAAGARARPARLGLPARPVRRRTELVPDRRADARSCSRRRENEELLLPDEEHRACGGSAATCCATSRTTRSPSASGSGCTCGWPTGCPSPSSPSGTRARSRSTWSRPPAPRSTSIPSDRSIAERAVDALTAGGRRRAAPDRIAGRGRPLRARARARRARGAGGACARRGSSRMLGEARYWLGDFDEAEARFRKAMTLAEGDDRVTAHAARFLADITLTIRGDDALAAGAVRAIAPGARGGSAIPVCWRARCSWRGGCRTGATGWMTRRPCSGRRSTCRALGRRARRVGRGAGARRARGRDVAARRARTTRSTIARGRARDRPRRRDSRSRPRSRISSWARRHAGCSELDEAIEHADTAVRILRELGARWELASVLGDRGTAHRVAGRLDDAELDLREAFVLCRDLNERALVTWTASELARTLAMQGDVGGARAVLAIRSRAPRRVSPGGATALSYAEAVTDLAEGDRPGARTRSLAVLAAETGDRQQPEPTCGRGVVDGEPLRSRGRRRGGRRSKMPEIPWSATDGVRRSESPSWLPRPVGCCNRPPSGRG